MAVYDTIENKRSDLTRRTLESLNRTVDWARHRLIVSDNGSCEETLSIFERASGVMPFSVILNGSNLGTARAINRGWSFRNPGEHALKCDNDFVVHQAGWADEMEEVFARDPSIGICGLKRPDLEERPDHEVPHYRSVLRMLPHQPGQRWIVIEEALHILGTCQAYSSLLLDKIGFLYQMQDESMLYAFDDALASLRAHVVGMKTVFLPHYSIDHIDPGGTAFTQWKMDVAGQQMARYSEVVLEYRTGKRSPYYDGGEDGKWAGSPKK